MRVFCYLEFCFSQDLEMEVRNRKTQFEQLHRDAKVISDVTGDGHVLSSASQLRDRYEALEANLKVSETYHWHFLSFTLNISWQSNRQSFTEYL